MGLCSLMMCLAMCVLTVSSAQSALGARKLLQLPKSPSVGSADTGRQLLQSTGSGFSFRTAASSHRRCLDVPGGNDVNQIQLQQYDCNGTPAQRFLVEYSLTDENGDDWYQIKSELPSYKCLDVYGFGTHDGAAVVLWDCNAKDNQLWRLYQEGGAHYIYPKHDRNKCMDISGGSADNGAPLQLWQCNRTPAQQFQQTQGVSGGGGGGDGGHGGDGGNGGGGSGGSSGCPAGWSAAVGTYYVSWPDPVTQYNECVNYSGCRWAGMFSRLSPGPAHGPCASSRWGSAEMLSGGNGTPVECRWPPGVVQSMAMAASHQGSPLLDQRVEVMVQGTSHSVTVNVMDHCADSDCEGCCSRNTGNGAYPLLDLEWHPALELLGSSSVGQLHYPSSVGLRPGAPETSVMPFCYRVLGPV